MIISNRVCILNHDNIVLGAGDLSTKNCHYLPAPEAKGAIAMTGHKSMHQNPDAIEWLDTLIKAHEADILEILENALWHFSDCTEGVSTLSPEELLERIRGAISRIQGQQLDREIERRVGE